MSQSTRRRRRGGATRGGRTKKAASSGARVFVGQHAASAPVSRAIRVLVDLEPKWRELKQTGGLAT